MTYTASPIAAADTAEQYNSFVPIVEDDDFLRAALEHAELPALLAALAHVNADPSILEESVKPPLPPMDAVIAAQGGLTPRAQERARELAFDGLRQLRDRGSIPAAQPTEELLADIVRFITKDAGDEQLPLLRHELGIPKDYGAPRWTKDDVAPDRDFTVAVIGAGISGMAAAHRLSQASVSYVVFDKNAEVGGTWWENVYPGCRLDTPNFAYSYSFAQKPDWPQAFSTQPEIEGYLQDVSAAFGLRPNIRFNTEVTALAFDSDEQIWTVTVRDAHGAEQQLKFHAVITAVGQLNLPNIPDIPGRDSFGGTAFHSSRWDQNVELAGRRVAVIGTGASAYQIVPSIADQVDHLSVFQRHAPWMLPTPGYHNDIPEGMQWLLRHVPYYGRWYRFWQFWLANEGRLPFVDVDPDWTDPATTSANNAHLRAQLIEHLRAQLDGDPDLLEKMTPTYPPGVKRMTRDNGVWAAALKKPHVDLITDGIASIEPTGIRTADGRLHEVDVIVYATGFRASDYLEPMTITGAQGQDLHQMWDGDARGYLGITVPHFPNLFMLMGPNTGVVVNGSSLFMAECSAEYTVECIGELLRSGRASMSPHTDAVDEFCDWVDEGNRRRAWGVATIETWYQNRHGRASQVWPYSLHEFYDLTRKPDLTAFDFHDLPMRENR